jgi:hypothetical protein
VVKCILTKCEALSSTTSTTRKKKKKREKKQQLVKNQERMVPKGRGNGGTSVYQCTG